MRSVDDDSLSLFGRKREECTFPLLAAAFTAEVDILLPTLYCACSDFSTVDIFRHAYLMSMDCLRVLIIGREGMDASLNSLVANLPDNLLEIDGSIECSGIVPCLRNARYRNLSRLISQVFNYSQGSKVVAKPLESGLRRLRLFRSQKDR